MPKTRRSKPDYAEQPGLWHDLRDRAKEHRLPMFAAAVAFFAFIALIPAIAAAVSITSLVADTDALKAEATVALENSPEQTRDFVVNQIDSLADRSDTGAGIAAVVGIVLSIFTASGAVGHLMEALNVVFDRRERRNFMIKRALAVGIMVGAIVLVAAMVFTMSVLPAFLNDWFASRWVRTVINVGRFLALGVLMVFGLTFLYRVGPSSDPSRARELVPGGVGVVLSRGALVGTVLIVALSWGFGVFVSNFGSYGETYGTLAGIIVVLLWLQLMALAVLVGAEVDAHLDRRDIANARLAAGLPAVRWTGPEDSDAK